MNQIRIITDSASDYVSNVPENVSVMPLTIRFGDEEFQDGVNITHEEFYQKLESAKDMPTTSLVSPDAFMQAFQEAVDAGDTVVAITISSKLSGTYQSACIAAADFEGKVYVVDSLQATLGEQILVQYAAEQALTSSSAQELAAHIEEMKSRTHLLGIVDTLEYLKRSGRISGASAAVGELLSMKPVLVLREGVVTMLGKARGPKKGLKLLIDEIESMDGIDFSKPLRIGYTGDSAAFMQSYVDASKNLYEGHEECLVVSTVGATIGTHVGPGALVVAFFTNK